MIKTLVKTELSALRDFGRQSWSRQTEFNSLFFYKQRVRQCQNTINTDGFKGALPNLKCVCVCTTGFSICSSQVVNQSGIKRDKKKEVRHQNVD